jgi:hypothetical protein
MYPPGCNQRCFLSIVMRTLQAAIWQAVQGSIHNWVGLKMEIDKKPQKTG